MTIKDPETVEDFWKNPKKYSETQIRNFIEKHPEKVDWSFWFLISYYQNLSEDFIREFQCELEWGRVSRYQTLSEGFLIEFIGNIKINWLNYNEEITEDVKQRIIDLKKVIDQ